MFQHGVFDAPNSNELLQQFQIHNSLNSYKKSMISNCIFKYQGCNAFETRRLLFSDKKNRDRVGSRRSI